MGKQKLGQKIAKAASTSKEALIPVLSEKDNKLKQGSAEDLILDLRRIQEEHPDKFLSRNFYRGNGRYTESCWSGRFGTFEEFKRQAGIDKPRAARRIELHTARHASMDIVRGFQEVDLNPIVGLYERPEGRLGYKRMIVAADFHGPSLDPFSMEVLLDAIKRVKPDIFVFAGDVYENYDFSRFDRDPRLSNLRAEFDFVRESIFAPIREACGYNCQIDMIVGNHDQMLLRHLAERSPYVKAMLDCMGISLAHLFGTHDYQINLVNKADLCAHNAKSRHEEIRKNYKVYYDMFVVDHFEDRNFGLCGCSGHTHKPWMKTTVDERMGSKFWISLGCMAKVDADYVTGLNKYQNGFAIIHLDTERKSCIGENIIINDDFTVVGGKVYYRSDK